MMAFSKHELGDLIRRLDRVVDGLEKSLTLREREELRRRKVQAMTWSGYDFVETRGKEDY
jgi:hypothetical protein